MADTISSALSAGTLSSTDATALTSALGKIDASLTSDGAGSGTGTTSGSGTTQAKLDPSSLKDRIDGLVADQVSSGSLTGDQATELKTLFASQAQSTQTSDAAGAGGVSGAGGPPPGPPPGHPPGDAASGSTGDSSTGGTASGASGSTVSGSTSVNDLLATFIQQLQSSQSGSTRYGAGGTSGSGSVSALLFDFKS